MTYDAHTIDRTANLKEQVDSYCLGLSFGYFEIWLACTVIEIIAGFWENSPIWGKFDPFLTPCNLNFDLIKKMIHMFVL